MERLRDDHWDQRLTREQFRVLRCKETEPPGTGALLHEERAGTFRCAGCGQVVFLSDAKYESGSGWPSFTAPASDDAITTHDDHSHGMERTEAVCSRCGGHLGHVFDDGPGPAGQRWCINSAALRFDPRDTP